MLIPSIIGEMAMGGTAEPKKFGQEGQISYRSTPELIGKFRVAASKLAVRHRFSDKVLKPGHLANALIYWVGKMSDDELEKVCLPLLRELEKYAEGAGAVLDGPPRGAHGETDPPKKRKRLA